MLGFAPPLAIGIGLSAIYLLPALMLELYRDAYGKMASDPEFNERARKISDEFLPMSDSEVETLITRLAAAPPQAIDYIGVLLRKQGLEVQ